MKQAMAAALSTLHAATKRRYEIACNALTYPQTEERERDYIEVRDELKRRLDELEAQIGKCRRCDS